MVFSSRVCVPVFGLNMEAMVDEALHAPTDLVELRLDYLSDFSSLEKIAEIGKDKIATCMPSWEGGHFSGSEKERVKVLSRCLPFVDYVTIELNTSKKLRNRLIAEAKSSGVKVIVGFHDFESTPTEKEIIRILNKEKSAGADIAKIAVTAKKTEDVLTLLHTLIETKKNKEYGIPVIAISMGEEGKISRIVAPLLGSYITYVSSRKGKESAPGQLSYEEMNQILSVIE